MKDINALILDELSKPKTYAPIQKGFLIALLCAGFCLLSVPFYLLMKCVRR